MTPYQFIRPKILLVDDRKDNLFSISSILEQDDYRLTKVTSGISALKILLKECDFTLILMDVEMPEMNGFETASMIHQREKLKHIPIIFITAHSPGDENIYKGYKAGAVDYIYKPILPDLLRAKVAVFVDLYRKNHQLLEQGKLLKEANKNLEIEIRDRIVSEEKVKELNLQLLKNIEKLESANKDLDQFTYIASHDLQEPLRKICMFNDFITSKYKNKLDREGRLYIERMQVACTRMQNLINDIIAFSKIDVSKETPVNTDLNLLLDELTESMYILIKEKKAHVTIGKMPTLPVYPSLIKLLFQHLINNSLKYSNDTTAPVIHISATMETFRGSFKKNNLFLTTEQAVNSNSATARPPHEVYYSRQGGGELCPVISSVQPELQKQIKINKYWRICIQDNGVGFEQRYAEKIFSLFKRLHGNAEYSGTGVGLAICKKIIEEHHGFISAKSSPNKGTIFTISLPVEMMESAGN